MIPGKKKSLYLIDSLIIFTLFILVIIHGCSNNQKPEWVSPYKNIDWATVKQAKAQFHTHTTRSDGTMSPQFVVDRYHELGYDILAITDHWLTTWPWQNFDSFEVSETTKKRIERGEFADKPEKEYLVFENRDPEKLGILPIIGSEPSYTGKGVHHIVSLFSTVTGQDMGFDEALEASGKAGGLISFAHPGRSVEKKNNTLEDYINYFTKYPNIYGIDIFTLATYNQPERWSYSTELISRILEHFGSPDNAGWRPVWFTATDDVHNPNGFDRAYQIQLVYDINEESVYKSLKEGAFFWAAKSPEYEVPVIESIELNKNNIKIKGHGIDHISWYFNNRIIHTGETFNLKKHGSDETFYVYFIAYSSDFSIENQKGAMIGSQPFWIVRK